MLREYKLGSRSLAVRAGEQGYLLDVKSTGTYTIELQYSVPVVERHGAWYMLLAIPQNLKNKVTLTVPAKDLEIESPQAVLLKTTEKDGKSETLAVYGSATEAHVSWRARVRKTKLEKVVFFCGN